MKKRKLVCLGDSLTEGYGVERVYWWSELLDRTLDIEIVNEGISGDTTGGMLARFKTSVIDHDPSHLLITGGTNDLYFGIPNHYIISNIMAMTRQARYRGIISVIGIPTPFFPPEPQSRHTFQEGMDYVKLIESYQEELRRYAKEDEFEVIDFSLNMEPHLFLEDGLHANEEGHRQMYKNARPILERIFDL
ncbi:arylesterase [Leptobacterium flavescens]|uniref:Arylesterase n=1 Tax=Leptobacterium flavescens TaxID=472055 RepID=A0A6P0UKX4_9FLAO|nr:GDSL-type esterase/lipase family protein [Leptobacterium flavescens]NER14021.1 arylesterase [Leptobacterium flavescens]